jgi:hypothetical protein
MSTELSASLITALAGFAGVLVGTAFVPWIGSLVARKRSARYLAIRIVCILDNFTDDCSQIASVWDPEDSSKNLSRSLGPAYPEDLDWHSINPSLMYDLLSLPTAVERLNRYLSGAADLVDDYSGYFDDRNYRYARLGIRANSMAERLRVQYKIHEFDPADWSPVHHLKEVVFDVEKTRKARLQSPSLIPPLSQSK